jgi:predicted double-glycine peptidase
MSYPSTCEERLVKLYGFSLSDLSKILKECNNNKEKYKQRLEELDEALASSVYIQITGDKFIVH